MSRADRPSRRDALRAARSARSYGGIKPMVNTLPFYEVLNQEGLEKIHKAAMRLLGDTGFLILDYAPPLGVFRQHGAKVEGNLIKIDEDTLMHYVRMAPSSFTQLARDPANNVQFGGRNLVMAPVYGPPYVEDYERGRQLSTLQDFKNFASLTHMIPELQHGGGTIVEPNDIDVKERHLDMVMAHITSHNKAFMGSVIHADNARDCVTMARILFGEEAIQKDPALISLINVSSPLRHDDRMLSVLEIYANARQALLITPFTVVGATSPTTLAATLAQLLAEALITIAYVQMLNPGSPCILGTFISVVDLRSGAPTFGTGENNLLLYAGAQLARYYNLPFRAGGTFNASRIPDAQAGYESASVFWTTVNAGTNFMLHAAGWLEGGLIAGYEKFISDTELLGMLPNYFRGVGLSDEDFAWDAYAEVGPGGHFLGAAHTMRHYETAFYQHKVFNMDNYEKWHEEGSVDTYKRAHGIWKKMLEEYQAPELDSAKKEELEAFMAVRKEEIRAGKARTEWKG